MTVPVLCSDGMTIGMKYEKIAISLPFRAAEHVRRAVKRGEAPSASAYIASAIEERANQSELRDEIDKSLEASGGPITPEERAWVEYVIGERPWTGPVPTQPPSMKGFYRYEPPKALRSPTRRRRATPKKSAR
jgi:Arc/MetJ-type ribon-helix-helix transcriptional regulator